MNSRRSWIVWSVAVVAYVVAVLHRSSLGVAGPDAVARFDISAAQLSSLAVVQLAVYAALQIPVGVLLDRFGPRNLILTGGLLLAAGQAMLAFSEQLPLAIVARILVGMGDAATFISVMRLLPAWFHGRLLPQISQWTGNIGQLGQLASAVPFAFMLHQIGWTWSFGVIAMLSIVVLIVAALLLADAPAGIVSTRTDSIQLPASWWVKLRESLLRPGTQLGFWAHFSTQSPGSVFALLWGYPLLVDGLGYDRGTASVFVSLLVLTGIVAGPLLGLATARFPLRRSNLVLTIIVSMAAAWALVLLWPGTPPTWTIIVMIITIGIGGPGSLIGFDFARSFNPVRSLGSANGVVNVGGFLASFSMMGIIGIVLDATDRMRVAAGAASDVYAWEGFRIAMCVQFVALGLGFLMVVITRRRTRRRMHEEEGITVGPLWIALAKAIGRR